MILYEKSSAASFLSEQEMRSSLNAALDRFGAIHKMLIVPPDITRLHSDAGKLAAFAYERDPKAVSAIIPALGTHTPMTDREIAVMFPGVPRPLFIVHRWRSDCTTKGEVPGAFVAKVTDGALDFAIPVAVNKLLFEGGFDCILSIGQVVPHEVAGFASHNKNIVVGLGGAETINKSHFVGAVRGIENIMGRAATPVRAIFDYAVDRFLGGLPIVHALTVMDRDTDGAIKARGLFIGTGKECFDRAAALSQSVNVTLLDAPLKKVVVHLDPVEYRSFWLGNKSVYRTRMAIATGGELIVLAPGIKMFGEDREIDRLIRAYGYKGTPYVMDALRTGSGLAENLSVAAHLIHGSSEGRFTITYCTRDVSRPEVENAGFSHAPIDTMLSRYDPRILTPGFAMAPDGEEIYFVPNPAIGLWAWRGLFARGAR